MNLPERYKKLKKQGALLIQKGMVSEYLKILREINRLENQINYSLRWN